MKVGEKRRMGKGRKEEKGAVRLGDDKKRKQESREGKEVSNRKATDCHLIP